MAEPAAIGPDVVVAGAARSGTSFLSALLATHPGIDPGAVKEPNYFSREYDRGPDWYDGLYDARRPGLLRLDGSMSYTFAHFPEAIGRMADDARPVVVYAVRHPITRLVSHFQLHRDYFTNESAATLGEALTFSDVYSGASDYGRWWQSLTQHLPVERLLLVPFPVLKTDARLVAGLVCEAAGLDPELIGEPEDAEAHRNAVVAYRHPLVRVARRSVRRAGLYPWLRRTAGSERIRWMRSVLTRPVPAEKLDDALASCNADQLERLQRLYDEARIAMRAALADQDQRRGLQWAAAWDEECPEVRLPGVPA
ncbi:sulfotransferase domain-containing protein [Nocardioides sp.]|uniref:sulfotransferase domain-containing protein n=1 Tax=Nocardioides sp. TaxID=35761 RepID=UPI002ED31F36